MNSSHHNLLTEAATAINIVLSLPTNSYIVWLIVTAAEDTMVREFFPLNLAVFEILFCLLSVGSLVRHFFPTAIYLSSFPKGFLWSGRPMLQCCICVEQYLAVVHPVLFLRCKTLRYKATFSGVTWAVIIGFSVFYTFTPSLKHVVFASECAVLISVMLCCYFSVLVALKRPRPGTGKTDRANNMKTRAFVTIIVIIVPFVGTYILWCIAILAHLTTWFSPQRKIFTRTCTFLTFISGFVQPLNHLQRHGKCSCRKPV